MFVGHQIHKYINTKIVKLQKHQHTKTPNAKGFII